MTSIRLHPKYGVNPSLDVCFWCGEAHGVALLGYNKGQEAPRHVVSSYEPCAACKEKMATGITLIEAETQNPTRPRPEIAPSVVPSGRWVVVTEDAVRHVFSGDIVDKVLAARKAFVEKGLLDKLIPSAEETA